MLSPCCYDSIIKPKFSTKTLPSKGSKKRMSRVLWSDLAGSISWDLVSLCLSVFSYCTHGIIGIQESLLWLKVGIWPWSSSIWLWSIVFEKFSLMRILKQWYDTVVFNRFSPLPRKRHHNLSRIHIHTLNWNRSFTK